MAGMFNSGLGGGGSGGLLGGGGGGGLETALLLSTILGGVGDTVNSFRGGRGRGGQAPGNIANNLLMPLLMMKQFGGFGGRQGRGTNVVGQDTPTEGTMVQTTPQSGTVAPIGPGADGGRQQGMDPRMNLFGMNPLAGLGGGF